MDTNGLMDCEVWLKCKIKNVFLLPQVQTQTWFKTAMHIAIYETRASKTLSILKWIEISFKENAFIKV